MDKNVFRGLAAALFGEDFLHGFYPWVEELIPDGHPVLDPLTDDDVTPNFGGLYVVLRLSGLLPEVEAALAAKAREAGLDPENLYRHSSLDYEWRSREVIYGSLDGLTDAVRQRFKGRVQPCLDELIPIASGKTLETLIKLKVGVHRFSSVIDAFWVFDEIDNLQRYILGLPQPLLEVDDF